MSRCCAALLLGALGILLTRAGSSGPASPDATPAATAIARLAPERLARVRADVAVLRQRRAVVSPASTRRARYRDFRAILHAHSYLSHDSRGTIEEIVAGAKAARVNAVFLTDHYTPDRRFLREAPRGLRDDILFISGTELSAGLLAFRIDGIDWPPEADAPEILERLRSRGGAGFIAHPEKRTDWALPHFVGMEIYNTHADAEDAPSRSLLESLRGSEALPRWLELVAAFRQYPEEAFASIFDVPTEILATWDRLNEDRLVVGIAGNDSHSNVGFSLVGGEKGLLEVRDALDRKVGEVRAESVPSFLFGGVRHAPGRKLMEVRLDPYPISFGYVSTHILAESLTERALFRALERGRCYVAFDWLADPTGFSFEGIAGRRRITMGETLRRGRDRCLVVTAPIEASLRLLRGGREVTRATAFRLEFPVADPGVYRAEVWVTIAGEERPWIYANPIRVE